MEAKQSWKEFNAILKKHLHCLMEGKRTCEHLHTYGLVTIHNRNHVASPREQGTVKWFDASKGYGFIQRQSGEDVFFEFSASQVEGGQVITSRPDG